MTNEHKPVWCTVCKSQNSFDRFPLGDIMTESGQAYMLRWKCRECGVTVVTTNPDYKGAKVESDT